MCFTYKNWFLFDTVPVVGSFVAGIIVVAGDGISWSVDLFNYVVFVLDVWSMMFTYDEMFYICRNLFIHKNVIQNIDRFVFLIFDEFS